MSPPTQLYENGASADGLFAITTPFLVGRRRGPRQIVDEVSLGLSVVTVCVVELFGMRAHCLREDRVHLVQRLQRHIEHLVDRVVAPGRTYRFVGHQGGVRLTLPGEVGRGLQQIVEDNVVTAHRMVRFQASMSAAVQRSAPSWRMGFTTTGTC